jgi:transcriptional regulator with XRE-family HTH domain
MPNMLFFLLDLRPYALYTRHEKKGDWTMLDLLTLGAETAKRRKSLGLRQADLVEKTGISRATLNALENGRCGELGFSKVMKIASAVGLELKLQRAQSHRPTLEDLLKEEAND